MLRNIWTQRIIWTIDCLAFGVILDHLTSSLLWAFSGVVVTFVLGNWRLSHPGLLVRRLQFDMETAAVIRTVFVTLLFFIECAVIARLIVYG